MKKIFISKEVFLNYCLNNGYLNDESFQYFLSIGKSEMFGETDEYIYKRGGYYADFLEVRWNKKTKEVTTHKDITL